MKRALAALLILAPLAQGQTPEVRLDAARDRLIDGRSFLVGFPQTKTRNALRTAYLGLDDQGAPVMDQARLPRLREAISVSVGIRNDSTATPAVSDRAQLIAWESLEALLSGQLIAGNASLLNGLRVAFPTATGGGERPLGDSDLPIDTPTDATGREYTGASLKDLVHARHYFLDGVTDALNFIAADPDGTIRAVEPLNAPFTQYTSFNTAVLPDANFTGVQSIQTTGYLLGNALDRYGKAVVGIGDRLWRAAYFDRQRAPGGVKYGERQEMLDTAVAELQRGAHAQFLAALPLAASLPEGELGYEKCRLDQTRVTAATAAALIEKIRRGEAPKLTDFSLTSSTDDIRQQLSLVAQLKATAATRHQDAESTLWRRKDSENQLIEEARQLRFGFTEQLRSAVGIDPGTESQSPYFGLRTAVGRENFKRDLADRIRSMLSASASSPLLSDGSELGQTVLALRRASSDVDSARNRAQSIPQQIGIEDQRNNRANEIILGGQQRVAALNVAMGILNSVSVAVNAGVSYTPPAAVSFSAGVTVTVNPNAVPSALLQNEIGRAQAIQQARLNDVNSEATIKNLLLQLNQHVIDLRTAGIQAQSAGAAVQALLARVDRLVENHIYFQESNLAKWYSDPSVIFEQERAELDYQDALAEYVRELYVLSQKLAVRWSEAFENPYLKSDGTAETVGGAAFDGFTQPESVFAIVRAAEGDTFLDALRAWDLRLRSARLGGQADIQSRISLRQDIFGFSDVVYNSDRQRFETNPDAAARDLNKRRFRALLLRNQPPADSRYWLRLEFPITYGQLSSRTLGTLASQPSLVLVSRSDWNVRITELSARVLGQNVAQDAFNNLRLDLFQYGKIEIPKYHPRQAGTYPNFLTFNLPLYYPDPEEASTGAFKFSLNAGINGAAGQPNAFVAQVEPTPFCDRWVLLVEKQANPPINLQNIEDIELTVKSRSNVPPPFFN
jgi:hypothetical protein